MDTKEISNGHVTLDWQCEFCKLLATPTYVSFSFFFFSWKYRLTKKASSGTPAPPPPKVAGRGGLEDSYEHPIQSQRENCKIVACFLSHYYLNRRQKIVLVSIDNFPFARNDLGPSPCTNSGFYRKSQLFSLMDVCYFSNFSLDYLPISNMP